VQTPKKVEQSVPSDKFTQWIAEALAVLGSDDHRFVPFEKIKGYLCDHMSEKLVVIPKLAKRALTALVGRKLVIAKKDADAFRKKGKVQLAPKNIGKRKKIERAVRAMKIGSEPLVPKILIASTGRISNETVM
jgi:hypothetical protein